MLKTKEDFELVNNEVISFKKSLLSGVKDILPLALAVMPWGILVGSLAIDTGLSFTQAFAMSVMMFAGAAQLVSLSLVASGFSFFTILFSIFFLTSQHFIYALNFREHIIQLPLYKRILVGFLLTDELFVIGVRHKRPTFPYLLGAGLCFYFAWLLFSLIGIFLASLISNLEKLHLDFSIIALLILIIVPMIKSFQCFVGVLVTLISICVFKYFSLEAGLVLSAMLGMFSAVCIEKLTKVPA